MSNNQTQNTETDPRTRIFNKNPAQGKTYSGCPLAHEAEILQILHKWDNDDAKWDKKAWEEYKKDNYHGSVGWF